MVDDKQKKNTITFETKLTAGVLRDQNTQRLKRTYFSILREKMSRLD